MPSNGKKRILFVAEAVTLAHVVRLVSLAKTLDLSRFEIHFAAARFDEFVFSGFHPQRWAIHSLSPETFLRSIETGSRLFDYATLARYVEEDLRVIDAVQPDLVVGDFRLSLAVSAPLRAVPYATLMNAHWSPFHEGKLPLPEIPLVRYLGVRLATVVFSLVRPLVSAYFAHPLNTLRRQHNLKPIGGLRRVNTFADHTLYADVPGLVPTVNLPPNHHYLGPVLWSPDVALPPWWCVLPEDRPSVYVTMGSSGPADLVPNILQALATLPVNVIVATAGRFDLDPLVDNAWGAPFLPGEQAARRAELVICNGGSATVYQSLAEGVPVLGIATNMDQFMTMACVGKAGAGRLLRAGQAGVEVIRATVAGMLESSEYRRSSRQVAKQFAEYQAPKRFPALVDRWLEAPLVTTV
ncbi:MAG: glycosyltransferase [Deferrisomatales bacterium]|nr:glycosyltransferase [Deferrisomatales bacterium]